MEGQLVQSPLCQVRPGVVGAMESEDREQPLRQGGSGGGGQERTWRDMGFAAAPQTAGKTRGAQGRRETIKSKTKNNQDSTATTTGAKQETATTTQGPEARSEGRGMGNCAGIRGMGSGKGTAGWGFSKVANQGRGWQ